MFNRCMHAWGVPGSGTLHGGVCYFLQVGLAATEGGRFFLKGDEEHRWALCLCLIPWHLFLAL